MCLSNFTSEAKLRKKQRVFQFVSDRPGPTHIGYDRSVLFFPKNTNTSIQKQIISEMFLNVDNKKVF